MLPTPFVRRSFVSRSVQIASLLFGLAVVWFTLPTTTTNATSTGTVVAWGDNTYGQTTVPPGLTGVTALAGGGGHTVALKSDGTVVEWGDNTFGQTTVPAGLTGVTAIAAGGYHSPALQES